MDEEEPIGPAQRAQDRLDTDPVAIATAFKAVFSHPQADIVLAWLMDTCRATETTIGDELNPIAIASAEGRRQVWLAVNEILSLDGRDIAAIRNRVSRAQWEDA